MRTLPLVALLAACTGSTTGPGDTDDPTDDRTHADPIELLDRYDGPSFAELLEVRVWGDLIVFCSGVQGINVYDASDPEDLVFLDRSGFEHSSNSYPRCQHLAIDEDEGLLYTSAHADLMADVPWIETFDASNPDNLTSEWSSTFPENLEGMEVHGDYLVVAAHSSGVLVYERSSNGSLVEVGRTTAGLSNPWSVRSGGGDYLYVADGADGIATLDLSVPANPTVVHNLDLEGTTKQLDVHGDRLFAALGSAGVGLLSLADPAAPVLLDHHDTPGSALAVGYGVSANALFVSDWNDLRVFDVGDASLTLAGREPITFGSGATTRSLGLAARDDVMFSSNWTEMNSYRYFPDRAAPDLFLNPSRLGLPDTAVGESTWDVIRLENHGTRTLELDGTDSSDGVEVADLPETLEPGETATVRVSWTPTSEFAFSGEVRFESNDPDQPEQPLGVFGNGGGISVGDTVDALVFPTLDGGTLSLADHSGPILLAYFATF